MASLHDVAILGATPAGFAAACRLAFHKRDVIVLDAPGQPCECPLADWAPMEFFRLAGLPKLPVRKVKAKLFRKIQYHNAGLDRTVHSTSRGAVGGFFQASNLRQALRNEAERLGVTVRSTSTLPAVELQEDMVRLLGTVHVTARMLIVAQGRPHEAITELALPARTVPHSALVVAGLDVPLRSAGTDFDGALHVVQMSERTELGLFFRVGGVVHLRMISNSSAAGTRAAELSAMLTNLQRAGVLPPDLKLGRAKGAIWHPPAGLALELETHVAKRCLLVGTAGGFVEGITGQSVHPSVTSALLGADVAHAALDARNPQESLMKFKNSWRKKLVEYLRPPSTSLHMLLPLLFVNQNIVGKFTKALLHGESI